MKNRLAIVSTFVKDILANAEGEILSTQKGGPAYFFSRIFSQNLGKSVKLITGRELEVKIKVTDKGEFGQACKAASCHIPRISANNLLISTLVNEWDISTLKDYPGRIFLDVQGYVRDPDAGFGKKRMWAGIASIAEQLFCIKANEQEITYLPPDFVRDQMKRRCLILTKGVRGSEIFYRNDSRKFPPSVIATPCDTLGAGDTYLASFVKEFIAHSNWQLAAQTATKIASEFLLAKKETSDGSK